MWEVEVSHAGLNKYRQIRGLDEGVVDKKATAQLLAWDEMWEKKQVAEQKKLQREFAIRNKEEKKELSITRTNEAQKNINELETILLHTLEVDDAINCSSLLDNKKFPTNQPTRNVFCTKKPVKGEFTSLPPEPDRSNPKYEPDLGFLDKLFPKSRKIKEEESERKFSDDHDVWKEKTLQAQKKMKK